MQSQNIIPQISRVQLKITHHTMNEENLNLNEKRESTDAKHWDDALKLFDKDFKAVMIKML